MSRETRAFEASAGSSYTYCIRSVATYENLFYRKDGQLGRRYLRHVRHGTGFAYRAKAGEWYLATNEHVVEHPLVTDAESDVEGIPAGSRKVRETARIVANEGDEDEPSQVPLTLVLADEALDLAVLKTSHPLKVMPYKIGRSSALRVGNAVQVRGYPLGAFAASNAGRVISVGQLDRERNWDHEDFAVDALLNAGNSGSPVLATSCKTGELELVGIYHAGYKDAQALNVVVAVDQLRRALETLEPTHRPSPSDSFNRAALVAALRAAPVPFLMPFADRVVRVDAERDGIRFALLDADYPLTSSVQVAFTVRDGDLAEPFALALPLRFGDRQIPWSALDEVVRDPGRRFFDALFKQLALVMAFRQKAASRGPGPQNRANLAALASSIRGVKGEQKDILQSIDFDAEDLLWHPPEVPAVNKAAVRPPVGGETRPPRAK